MRCAWTWELACITVTACAMGACAQEEGGMTFMDWGRELAIVGSVNTHGTAQAVALRGDLAFVCASWHGLLTVDVSDPLWMFLGILALSASLLWYWNKGRLAES